MRASGVLLPVFSLPSKYGIGTFGKEAYKFIDFLSDAGQTYWQILPICPTSYGDSPYQSFSCFAGNPYFIDFDILKEKGLLKNEEYENIIWCESDYKVDYEKLFNSRYTVLKAAYKRFISNPPEKYKFFCEESSFWLEDYALYMALKTHNENRAWYEWEDGVKFRDPSAIENAKITYASDMEFYKVIQYFFADQWFSLKKYANLKNIKIIGDMPIYVAYDSADVWANTNQFLLSSDLKPKAVAGCPPDAFSTTGQLWGNPLYDWEYMKNSRPKFLWWRNRIAHSLDLYDVTRIDHFRAFESFYSIPYGDKTAENGKWLKCPGKEFFESVTEGFGELPIIAEDLGTITEEVRDLLKTVGFPGMKVLQFAFSTEEESSYLPHNHIKNCVLYTGTHDNDTINGWAKSISPDELKFAKDYMRVGDNESINWAMIKTAMSSVADTVIIPMQDFIGLGSEARINTPSTDKENWIWRIDGICLNSWLSKIIYDTTATYKRLSLCKHNEKCTK